MKNYAKYKRFVRKVEDAMGGIDYNKLLSISATLKAVERTQPEMITDKYVWMNRLSGVLYPTLRERLDLIDTKISILKDTTKKALPGRVKRVNYLNRVDGRLYLDILSFVEAD